MFGQVFFSSVTFGQGPQGQLQTFKDIGGVARIAAPVPTEGTMARDLRGRSRISNPNLMLLGVRFLVGQSVIKAGTPEAPSSPDPGTAAVDLGPWSYRDIGGRAFIARGGTIRIGIKDVTGRSRIKGGTETVSPPSPDIPGDVVIFTGSGNQPLKGRARIFNPAMLSRRAKTLGGQSRIKSPYLT